MTRTPGRWENPCMECNAASGYPCYNSDNERMEGVHDSRGDFPTYDALVARCERLEGALRELAAAVDSVCDDDDCPGGDACIFTPMLKEARAALAKGE